MQAQKAIQRLSKGDKPWLLTVSFENPHPPYIVARKYASYYLQRQDSILVPPNALHQSDNDSYARKQELFADKGFRDTKKVKEWTAIYYAMIEQVDEWIGVILDELEKQNVA